jgi:hypothetical protein
VRSAVMEEKRPGQEPEAEQRSVEQDVSERAAPKPHAPDQGRERELIEQAQEKARRDREEARRSGHGDHQGEDGF